MEKIDQCLTYTPEQARIRIGCGRAVIYEALRQNLIPHLKLGRNYIIPKISFHRWLDGVATQNEVARLNSKTRYQLPRK